MRGGRRFASSLFVTYHGFAAQGEHIGRAAPQGSRPNIHFRNECQINFCYDGKGSHLAVLFQAKSFAEHEARENRIIISGHRFPWCFHHEMPCKKCCLKYLRFWSRTKVLPWVRCPSKRVVSPKTFLEQPLYCRTKIPSHNIRDSLNRGAGEVINLGQGCLQHTADSAEDSK